MRRIFLPAMGLGLGVTLVVLLAQQMGWLAAWERQSIDFRFRAVPRPSERMTTDIVHVDIDDGALDSVGRWPWDRSTLARVIDELKGAGAKTIALDLLLSEEQRRRSDDPAVTARAIADDAAFARALASADCVLAVDIHAGAIFGADWTEAALTRLLDRIGADIQQDARLLARTIDGLAQQGRFLARPLQFKRAAAWHVLENADPPLESLEAFERHVAPNRGEVIGAFPEQPLLRSVWNQHQAWRALRPKLLRIGAGGSFKDRVPLPEFARGASAVGSVGLGSPDEPVREIPARLSAPGGTVLQFGLAAAARFRGVEPADVILEPDRIVIGPVELPLRDGRLWIDWPRFDRETGWEGLLRARPDAPRTAGHVSIGAVVSLADQRKAHERNLAQERRIAIDIVHPDPVPDGPITAELRRVISETVAFELEDFDPQAAYTEADRAWLGPRLAWREIERGELALQEATRRLRAAVGGRLVFVGWTATGAAADFFNTAIDLHTPGVVVHAVVADMALSGRFASFAAPWVEPVLVLVLGLLCSLAAARLVTPLSALAAGVLLGTYTLAVGGWLFARQDFLAPMVAPLTAGSAAWVACTALQAGLSQRDRLRITRQFRARVSSQLVDRLVERPDAVTMTGEERELTVIIGDLAGFTAISERLGGPATVSTLNRYMKVLTQVLIEEGAYLNKFLGDGLLAFWSAFTVDAEQASHACRAALRCQRALEHLNDDPQVVDVPRLGLRIGVATGRVVVGDCGAPPALNDYTVIGDAVNLAARLESANKQFGTKILVNGRTRELAASAPARLRTLGRIVVVGQTVPVEVYEVLPPDTPDELLEWSERAVDAYGAGQFVEALTAFDELEQRFGPSPWITLYRQAMYVVQDDFDGALHLSAK